MIVVKNCKVSGISLCLLANKVGRIFMDPDSRYETPRSETKDFVTHSAASSMSFMFPSLFLASTQISQGDAEAQWMWHMQ